MQDNMEDKQKELEDKLKDQVGNAEPRPQPQTEKPIGYGEGVTINGNINGGNVIIGNTAPITINLMLPCPAMAAALPCSPIYIGIATNQPATAIWRIIAQKGYTAVRQITRKFSAINPKSRQISRNYKLSQNTPQPQQSRHFHPNPFSSLIPPYIPPLHTDLLGAM